MDERILIGTPLPARLLRQTKELAERCGLGWVNEDEITFTALLTWDGKAVATASLCGNVVKCVAVDPACRGEGVLERLMTALLTEAARFGKDRLFLYTKPGNGAAFKGCGFFPVAEAPEVLLMENSRSAFPNFLKELTASQEPGAGPVGAIVANADPFTRGHLYLVEQAAVRCGTLHLFILADDRGAFPAVVRLKMAREATAHLSNVAVHSGGPYLISSATFPSYFLKSRADASRCAAELDISLFLQHIALALGITHRFVGTEPFCQLTAAYNRAMSAGFAGRGVELVELPRLEESGRAISASEVRRLLSQDRQHEAATLVPASSARYFDRFRKEDIPCQTL